MTRPGPLLWLRYAIVGSLPPKYSDWVLHDLTTGTWFARHIARVLTMLVIPETLLVLLIPASAGVRALTAFTVGACVVLLMSILVNDVVERLAQKAGYGWGTAERVRHERMVASHSARVAAYRERRARRHPG